MPMEPSSGTKRRMSVKGNPNVYYRVDRNGRRKYEVSFTDWRGQRCWRVVPGTNNLSEAVAARDDLRARVRRGERISSERLTVAEFAPRWLEGQTHLRPRTREKYSGALRLYVVRYLGHVRLNDLNEDHILELVAEMRRRRPGSARRCRCSRPGHRSWRDRAPASRHRSATR